MRTVTSPHPIVCFYTVANATENTSIFIMVKCCKEAAEQSSTSCPSMYTGGWYQQYACQSLLAQSSGEIDCINSRLKKIYLTVLNIPNCLYNQLTHSSDKHTYPTRHATRGLVTVRKSRTDSGDTNAQYSIER